MFICSFRQGSLNDAAEKYYRQAANLRPNVSTQAMLHVGRVPCKHMVVDFKWLVWLNYRWPTVQALSAVLGLFSKHQSQTLKRRSMSGKCTVKLAKHSCLFCFISFFVCFVVLCFVLWNMTNEPSLKHEWNEFQIN